MSLTTETAVYRTGNAAEMSAVMPHLQEAQANFQKARRIGNQADSEFEEMR